MPDTVVACVVFVNLSISTYAVFWQLLCLSSSGQILDAALSPARECTICTALTLAVAHAYMLLLALQACLYVAIIRHILLQARQEYFGYRGNRWSHVSYLLLLICSGGMLCLAYIVFPNTRVWFLSQCPLSEAEHVLVKVLPAKLCFTKQTYDSKLVMSIAMLIAFFDKSIAPRFLHAPLA